jgi:hypothetical protein
MKQAVHCVLSVMTWSVPCSRLDACIRLPAYEPSTLLFLSETFS